MKTQGNSHVQRTQIKNPLYALSWPSCLQQLEVHLCATNAKAKELAIAVADAVIFGGVDELIKSGLEDGGIRADIPRSIVVGTCVPSKAGHKHCKMEMRRPLPSTSRLQLPQLCMAPPLK